MIRTTHTLHVTAGVAVFIALALIVFSIGIYSTQAHAGHEIAATVTTSNTAVTVEPTTNAASTIVNVTDNGTTIEVKTVTPTKTSVQGASCTTASDCPQAEYLSAPEYQCVNSMCVQIQRRIKASSVIQVQQSGVLSTSTIQEKREQIQADVTERREAVQLRLQDKRENVEQKKEDIQQKREERKAALALRAQERIKAFVVRILRRFDAALDRLEKLANRMESRIEKLEERDLDLSTARDLLLNAHAEIAAARNDIANIESQIDEALTADNARDTFTNVRALIREASDSIRRAHKALVEAIREIKAGITTRTDLSGDETDDGADTTNTLDEE